MELPVAFTAAKFRRISKERGALDKLAEECHVSVSLIESDNVVVFRGRGDACRRAEKRLVTSLIFVVVEMSVPFQKHSQLIGKGGAGINKIRTEFNVSVNVPPRGSMDDIVHVASYDIDQVEQAIQAMLDLMAIQDEQWTPGHVVQERRPVIEFPVPYVPLTYRRHRAVIPAGELHKVANNLGVDVSLLFRDEQSDAKLIVTDRGGGVAACEAAVNELVAKWPVVRRVPVAAHLLSRVVGKNGASIRRVRSRHRVCICVPERGSVDPRADNYVTIVGLKANVMDAERSVIQLVNYSDKVTQVVAVPPST